MSDPNTTGKDQKQTEQQEEQKSVERREFLKRGVVTLGAGWLGLGGVRELLASAQGISARAYVGPAGAASIEPFRIAIVGDSVAWGQGLAEPNKYSSKVQAYLASQLNGRPIEKQVHAHSGAKLYPSDSDRSAAARIDTPGELPHSYPSIIYQATTMVQNRDLVDLVLLDGGINDIGGAVILDPTVDEAWVSEQTTKIFNVERYTEFLRLMRTTFPKATIVLTNYFRVISHTTDLLLLANLAGLIGGAWGHLIGLIGGPALRDKLNQHYRVFDWESTALMQRSVAALADPKVLFVDNGFDYNEAFGAPNRMLWNPLEPDEVGAQRKLACEAFYPEPRILNGGFIMCVNASIAHPNVRGAGVYASKIIEAIKPFVPSWAAPTVAALKPMAVSVVTGAETTSSQTITVHAKDAATGQPLSGTVKINGVTAPTGQQFTFPRCYTTEAATTDAEGQVVKPTLGLRTKVYTACRGTVSVAGYLDGSFDA